MKIFIIAGEDSGDKLGSAIIDGLRDALSTLPIFVGIGGADMKSRGLSSIFPMSELSIMGFTQIAGQYNNLRKRLNQTVSAILDEQPDILLTIDAPEFCFRVAKKIKSFNRKIPIIHYVAPSVSPGGLIEQELFQITLIMFWLFLLNHPIFIASD